MSDKSSFRNYRSDRLSIRDLEEIRAIILDCIDNFSENPTPDTPGQQGEYLKTAEVAKMTGFSPATLEAFRYKRSGPPFYKQGYNVRYKAEEVRDWVEKNRFQ